MKPPRIDTKHVVLMKDNDPETRCISCLDSRARWLVGLSADPYCSYCLLYSTDWGKENAEGISGLGLRLEAATSKGFIDKSGKIEKEHADRIMVSIWQSCAVFQRLSK